MNEAGRLEHLEILANITQVAGTTQTITINTIDTNGGIDTTYTGDHALTFSGANLSPDGTHPKVTDKNNSDVNFVTPATITFTNGVATVDMSLSKAENAEVEPHDGHDTPPVSRT